MKNPSLIEVPKIDDATDPEAITAMIAEIKRARQEISTEIEKRIVGQKPVVELLLTALFARGHCLFVGVPGLAKTLLISTLAEVLSCKFGRIQFTPDLMPSDITGTDVLEEDQTTGKRVFRFLPGPIFTNVLLADEINRTPPKTQAALLQAMQEHRVTAGGKTHPLEPPFLVFATQNPIEQEGTYPLPEAQLDRFMLEVDVTYPSLDEEVQIARTTTSGEKKVLSPVLSQQQIMALQDLVLRVPVPEHVVRYAVNLVRATRPARKEAGGSTETTAPDFVQRYVSFGAGPRASQFLILGAKARALLDGRSVAELEDVRALARPTLQHRVIVNFNGEAEGIRSIDLIGRLLEQIRS